MKRNYAEQDGCHNCKHVFALRDYKSETEFYCALDGEPRPLCGSTQMEEFHDTLALAKKWDEWSIPRMVKSFGKCEEFKRKA